MSRRALPSARERLAARVRQVRLERGLSQGRLAELTGLHLNTVGALERGLLNASIDVIERVALALEVPLIDLFAPLEPGAPPADAGVIPPD